MSDDDPTLAGIPADVVQTLLTHLHACAIYFGDRAGEPVDVTVGYCSAGHRLMVEVGLHHDRGKRTSVKLDACDLEVEAPNASGGLDAYIVTAEVSMCASVAGLSRIRAHREYQDMVSRAEAEAEVGPVPLPLPPR